MKEEKALLRDQKCLLIWYAFKAQSTTKVEDTLASYGVEPVMVPKNMTYLLQPLDVTTNGSLYVYMYAYMYMYTYIYIYMYVMYICMLICHMSILIICVYDL